MAWEKFRKKKVPDGLWMKCNGCQQMVFKKLVEEKLNVCPDCNCHYPISARQRIALTLDENSYYEYDPSMAPVDALNFSDLKSYRDRLKAAQELTGLKDAVLTGEGTIDSKPVVFSALDSRFIMGTMGSVVGEKITRAFERATEKMVPLIAFSASGGARMHESCLSLAQMSKTSAAVARYSEAGGFFISVLVHPCYGGVSASYAFLGDIILAEPKADIGFAGPRTILHTLKMELPKGFQSSEFHLENGFIDMVVERSQMKKVLSRLIDYFKPRRQRREARAVL